MVRSKPRIALVVDGDTLGLTLDQAAKLARAGERIEKTLFKAKEAPKESSTVFAYKLRFRRWNNRGF